MSRLGTWPQLKQIRLLESIKNDRERVDVVVVDVVVVIDCCKTFAV